METRHLQVAVVRHEGLDVLVEGRGQHDALVGGIRLRRAFTGVVLARAKCHRTDLTLDEAVGQVGGGRCGRGDGNEGHNGGGESSKVLHFGENVVEIWVKRWIERGRIRRLSNYRLECCWMVSDCSSRRRLYRWSDQQARTLETQAG